MKNTTPPISVRNLCFEKYNPFGATPEELLAAALDVSGLINESTTVNDLDVTSYLKSYYRKRAQYHETSKLGSLLVRHGVLTRKELDKAVKFHKANAGMKLGEALVSLDICSMEDIEERLEEQGRIRQDITEPEDVRARIEAAKKKLRDLF